MREIEKMTLASEDPVSTRLMQLKKLMPEAFSEGGIDFEKLRLLLGDEVDESQERYAFTWPGKADAIRQSQTVTTATLRPCPEKSRGRDGEDGSFDSDNIYIEGDNLEVLKLLQRGYHGKIKMVYIDPPYNTGHDFVYKDKFGDTIENYKEQAGLASQSNVDTSGRYHSNWCSMMYPRLKLARELLSDDGIVFISIDDHELKNLENICDEIFGSDCHVETIIWKNKYGAGAKTVGFIGVHEYILCYSKLPVTDVTCELDEEGKKRFSKRDSHFSTRGGYMTQPLMTNSLADRPNLMYPIEYNGDVIYPRKQWVWGKERLLEAISKDEIEFSKQNDGTYSVRSKSYLYDENGLIRRGKPTSVQMGPFNQVATEHLRDLFEGKAPFDFSKPVELISFLVSLQVNGNDGRDDLILDFFSGSATTAEAVMQLNEKDGGHRRSILVQLPELSPSNSCAKREGYDYLTDIGEERIRRAGDKIKAKVEKENAQHKLGEETKCPPDIGFRVFTLDDSGIERPEPGQLMLDVVKSDRTELDIVFEMMLKWGLELTLPVEKSEAAGYPIWSVACDELVCCMSRGLTIEALGAIADMEPRRVLILDSVLDDTLKLNAVQIFKHAGERMGCEIELRTV